MLVAAIQEVELTACSTTSILVADPASRLTIVIACELQSARELQTRHIVYISMRRAEVYGLGLGMLRRGMHAKYCI
jgi:hypothetical protein